MKEYNEFDIVQNTALSTLVLWTFVKEYSNKAIGESSPLLLCYFILPLVYKEDVAAEIASHNLDASGLFKFLQAEPVASLNLSKRIDSMFAETSAALNMAFSAKLLSVDPDSLSVVPLRTSDAQLRSEQSKRILKAAKRLGAWCSQFTFPELLRIFQITL